MPSNRSMRKKGQPRRTHNLGGCNTCRQRHVKCDRRPPLCAVCQDSGLQCGGFPSLVRWASISTGPPAPKPARPDAGVEASIPASIDTNIASNDINAIPKDSSSTNSDCIVGTAAAPSASLSMPQQPEVETNLGFGNLEPGAFSYPSTSSWPELDSLLGGSSGLGWNDLFFDPTADFSLAVPEDTSTDPHGILGLTAGPSPYQDIEMEWYDMVASGDTSNGGDVEAVAEVPNSLPPPYSAAEMSDDEVLEDAKLLLKYYRDVVIPQFAPLPMNSRSPWEILNWSAAVQTHAEMTFLEDPGTKHANKANLFGILSCSAYAIIKNHSHDTKISVQRARCVLEYASNMAKGHMQESLKVETSGPRKAKYKEQLMAIFSLIALATMRGDNFNARCYLIEAERLVRLRGLAKVEVSRRARLLHHVYTWLRIIGESTFVLHDDTRSGLEAKVEDFIKYRCNTKVTPSSSENGTTTTGAHSQPDDFLRIVAPCADSDSDVDSAKDQEAGIQDIHLADPRPWPKTLYMDIYGIPEIWLSLVSQTTRVANIVDLLERKPLEVPRPFAKSLQRKQNRLEDMVCTFSSELSDTHPLSQEFSDPPGSAPSMAPLASRAMLRAMCSALVIFFYRRVRKVHPFILQTHVDDVINALQAFDATQSGAGVKTPGTPWPAFIAGCEAMSHSSRKWLLAWMQKGEHYSASNGFTSSQKAMKEVWERRDATDINTLNQKAGNSPQTKGDVYSWVDVLQEGNIWLMLF